MSKFWNTANQKLITSIGMGITGYYILSKAFPSLWQLPGLFTQSIGPFSIIAISAVVTLYSIWFYNKKF